MSVSSSSLLDTNVLVYRYYQQSPQHAACRALLDKAQQAGAGLCVAPQNLSEFFAVVTNPKRVTQAKSPVEALDLISELLALPGLALLSVPMDVVDRWMNLVRGAPVAGAKVFDAQLVAIMLSNGVDSIYTFNVADFQSFGTVRVLTP
jgi:toxin-antitoxin system PIN domain toxin